MEVAPEVLELSLPGVRLSALAWGPTDGPLVVALLLPGQIRNSWYTVFNQLPVLPERFFDPLVRRLWKDWSPGYDATTDLAHLTEAMLTSANRRAAIGYYRALPRFWAVPRRYRGWHSTWTGVPTVPSLNLYGLDDGCFQPKISQRAAAVLPDGAGLVGIPGAGHFLHLEQPDQVNTLIAEFIAPLMGDV